MITWKTKFSKYNPFTLLLPENLQVSEGNGIGKARDKKGFYLPSCINARLSILLGRESLAHCRIIVLIILSSAPTLPCCEKMLLVSEAVADSCAPGTVTAHWCCVAKSFCSLFMCSDYSICKNGSCCWRRTANTFSLQMPCRLLRYLFSDYLSSDTTGMQSL